MCVTLMCHRVWLHRWDRDWYIQRRHAVMVVQSTYYLVYNVMFITPVLLTIKPPHALRHPLWMLRVSATDCLALQLCYQVRLLGSPTIGCVHVLVIPPTVAI